MDRISRPELLGLTEPGTEPRVSIYLPLIRTYPDCQQNPIHLRDSLDEAARKLEQTGMSSRHAKDVLEPARSIAARDELIELNATSGLALLIGEGRHHSYFLPYFCSAAVDVGSTFRLAPLMRLLTWPIDFLLLTLSGNAVRLLRCTRKESVPVELPAAVPKSLEEFLQGTEFGRPIRFQTGAGTTPSGAAIGIVHGGTSYKDDATGRIEEYVKTVARGISSMMHADRTPLVVAAVHDVNAMFRSAYTGQNLIEQAIHGSPDELGAGEMRTRAACLVETVHSGELKAVLDRYVNISETSLASNDAGQILLAASTGRIDSLVAAFDQRLWGTWDAATQTATLSADPAGRVGEIDLLDLALSETFRHGGRVCVVPRSQVPGNAPMTAILRW